MVVIAHQAEGVEQPALLEDFLGEQVEEDQPVFVVFEEGFLAYSRINSCEQARAD